MSLCTNQQLTVLAAVSGCLAEMQQPGKVSQVLRRQYIEETEELVNEVIAGWEATGDDLRNFERNIKPAILKWHDFLEGQRRITLSPVNLACMCARVIQDQLDRCSDRRKLYNLREIATRIEAVHSFFDPEASNIVAFEESGYLMDYLYKMISWDFEWRRK